MRSDFTDPGKVIIACKAGFNDDPHHGHLDVGQFVVYWKGTAYISDHGPAAYDEKFFDEDKYNTPQASSIGHNLIFVNGERQISGKRFRQPVNENIGGKILEFRPGKERDYTLLDATNAYPKKELKKWRRHIILEKPVITVVVDEVLQAIVQGTAQALGAKACSLMLLSPDGRQLLHTAAFGLSDWYMRKGPVRADQSMVESLHGQVVAVDDAPRDPRIQYREQARREGRRED